MPDINVSTAFKAKNDILRKLLHKGKPKELKFWGMGSNAVGGRQYLVTLTSGWNHKQHKDVETDQVVEVLKVNNFPPLTAAIMKTASGCDIVYEDDTFDRYSIQGKAQLKEMTGEWSANLTPSFQDKTVIT